jgi:DNA invertase Pin-like site-specific DNA recombinase
MKIGYVRVSTKEQNSMRQELLMEELNVDNYIEKVSGKNTEHPKLRENNTVIVESISRFARNTKYLLELIEKLEEKNVNFISQKESIDTTEPSGKFILTVFGAMAELDRSYILDSQREGIESMVMNEEGIRVSSRTGNTTGRPKAQYPHSWEEEYKEWKKGNQTAKVTMQNLNLKRTTFYKLANLYDSMI